MRMRFDCGVVAVALATLAGCSILKPQVDPSRFYVLTATASRAENAVVTKSGGLKIGIGPIFLPDYLQRSQLVTRLGPNRVAFSDSERWAEPLERNFTRVVIENVIALLDTEKVISLPAIVPVPTQYEVPIEVQRFESDDKGAVELVARWAIRAPDRSSALRTGECNISETGGPETEEVVAALSRAVGRMSKEIANEIQQLAKK